MVQEMFKFHHCGCVHAECLTAESDHATVVRPLFMEGRLQCQLCFEGLSILFARAALVSCSFNGSLITLNGDTTWMCSSGY
jgi:hypothetical protein